MKRRKKKTKKKHEQKTKKKEAKDVISDTNQERHGRATAGGNITHWFAKWLLVPHFSP